MAVEQSISSSPVRQALFTQEKLEKIYKGTHEFLGPYRKLIELFQDVLVWKKPVASIMMFIVIHWMFIIYVKTNATLVTSIGNIIFWMLLGDVLWRAASKDGFGRENGSNTRESNASMGSRKGSQTSWPAVREMPVPFETLLIQRHTPRGPNELPSFSLICLWISEAIMWLDNLVLALRHWSVHEPIIFTFALALPGIVLSLIGKYIPTTVFLYIIIMGLVVWPYIEYHSLRRRTVAYVTTQYPGVLRRAKSTWFFLKAITVNRDKSDDPELSLSQGIPDLQTQRSLQEAFDRFTATPIKEEKDELELQDKRPQAGSSSQQATRAPVLTDHVTEVQRPNAFPNPSNDSLLLDSLNPGPGEFPSITDLDASLALPQFPPGDNVLTSMMPTIAEEGYDVNLPRRQESTELDPLLDSVQLEFGGFDFPDGRSSIPRTQATPHPLSTTHRAQPVNPQPSAPPMELEFESGGFSPYQTGITTGQTGFGSRQSGQIFSDFNQADERATVDPDRQGFTPNFIPPPSYQQVASGSPDAGITVDGNPGGMFEWGGSDGVIPKSSSTPNVQDNSTIGIRQRPNSGTY